jgi:hypothetical protein
MLAGLLAATIVPQLFPDTSDIYLFPLILLISFVGCFMGVYFAKADDMEVLKHFYKTTKPWGFWKPVIREIQKENPDFQPNRNFLRDAFNCLIGIIWQMTFVLAPIYLIIKEYYNLAFVVLIMAITSVVLKKTWYDRLKNSELADKN